MHQSLNDALCSSLTAHCLLSLSPLFQDSKLWIIMEYLGGGSALDLVSDSQCFSCSELCSSFLLVLTGLTTHQKTPNKAQHTSNFLTLFNLSIFVPPVLNLNKSSIFIFGLSRQLQLTTFVCPEDGARSLGRDPDCHHPEGDPEGPGVPALGEENPPGYQR